MSQISSKEVFGIEPEELDIEIINSITQNGISFFTDSYLNLKNILDERQIDDLSTDEKSEVIDYFKTYLLLYLTPDNGIWNTPVSQIYLNLEKLISIDGILITELLMNFLEEPELIAFLNNFLENIEGISYQFHKEITKNKDFLQCVLKTSIWKSDDFKKNYLGKIVIKLIDSEINKSNIDYHILDTTINNISNQMHDVCFSLLKFKETRSYMINWFYNVLEYFKDIKRSTFKPIITIDQESYTPPVVNINKFHDSTYLCVVNRLLIKLLLKGIKVEKIDYNLLDSDECKFNIKNKDESSLSDNIDKSDNIYYNFISHAFFMVNKYIDLTTILWIKELDFRKDELEQTKELQRRSLMNGGIAALYNYIFKDSLQISKDKIEYLTNMLSTTEPLINDFNKYFIQWLRAFDFNKIKDNSNETKDESNETKDESNETKDESNETKDEKEINSFMDTMIQNNIDIRNYYKKHELTDDYLDIITKSFTDNQITNNPHIKCQFVDLLMIYFEKHVINPYSSISDKVIYMCQEVAPKLIDMLIYTKECLSSGELYDIVLPQYRLCFLINHLILNNKSRFQHVFDKLDDPKLLKKLVSIVNSNFEHTFGEAAIVLKKIGQYQRNPDIEMDDTPESLKRKCQFYCCSAIEFLFSIKKLTQNFQRVYMEIEIKDSFINIVSSAMESLLGPNRKDFKVTNAKEIGFEPITYLIYMKDILINLSSEPDFNQSLAKNQRIDYLKYLDMLLSILNMKGYIDVNQESSINLLKFTLEKEVKILEEKQKKLEEVEDEIPDEFFDPIMATLIEEPIMLPSTKVIMDKTVITRHLINEQEDPFNRDRLTMEMIEEFNKKPEIKNQLEEFKSKLSKFLE